MMLTSDKVIGIFCFIDDLLQISGHQDDGRRRAIDFQMIITAGRISAILVSIRST